MGVATGEKRPRGHIRAPTDLDNAKLGERGLQPGLERREPDAGCYGRSRGGASLHTTTTTAVAAAAAAAIRLTPSGAHTPWPFGAPGTQVMVGDLTRNLLSSMLEDDREAVGQAGIEPVLKGAP